MYTIKSRKVLQLGALLVRLRNRNGTKPLHTITSVNQTALPTYTTLQ